ncbi:MAG: hypothetical protein NUW02_02620 [Candidatus Campbellbacteria bacterium]|nr:hypothetical protein [Candidatus Campbellbacteria bacterium]
MIVQKYIEYLKDNPEKYWFKRKIFGWGWTPATWQGWLILLLFIALIVGNAYRTDTQSLSGDVPVAFLVQTFILVIVLIAICYKTGEKPRWQWGFPKKDNDIPRT